MFPTSNLQYGEVKLLKKSTQYISSGGSSMEHWGGPFLCNHKYAPKGVAGRKFPECPYNILEILTTLPVKIAKPERLFSKLNNLVNYQINHERGETGIITFGTSTP